MGQTESLSTTSASALASSFLKLSQQYCAHSQAIPTSLLIEFFSYDNKDFITTDHSSLHYFLSLHSLQTLNPQLSFGPYFYRLNYVLFIHLIQFLPFFDLFLFSHLSKSIFLLTHENRLWFMIFAHTFRTQNILPSPLPTTFLSTSSSSSSASASSSSSSSSSFSPLSPRSSPLAESDFRRSPHRLTKCCWRLEFFSQLVAPFAEPILMKIIKTLVVKKKSALLVIQEEVNKLRNKIQKEKEKFEIEYHRHVELRRTRYYQFLHGFFLSLFLLFYYLGLFELLLLPSYTFNQLCLYFHLYPASFQVLHVSWIFYTLSWLLGNLIFFTNYLCYIIVLCYLVIAFYRHCGLQPVHLSNHMEVDRILSLIFGLKTEIQTRARYDGRLQLIDNIYEEELTALMKQQQQMELVLGKLEGRLSQTCSEDCILM